MEYWKLPRWNNGDESFEVLEQRKNVERLSWKNKICEQKRNKIANKSLKKR
jgi:hypothetical protein